MKIYFTPGSEGRLNGWSSRPSYTEGECHREVPEDHEVLTNPEVFVLENGELIKDTEYQRKLLAEAAEESHRPTDDEMNAIAIMELTSMILGGV